LSSPGLVNPIPGALQINLSAIYNQTCPACGGRVDESFAVSEDELRLLLNAVSKQLHEDLNPELINQLLFAFTSGKLMEALNANYSATSMEWNSPDNAMLSYLRNNIFQFSAAKSLNQQLQMAKLLIDDNGKVKSYSQFKKDVTGVNILFNKRYMLTEYNHAIATAQMNSKWVDFVNDSKNNAFLVYRTAGDANVRDSHAALDNFKAHINDLSWNTIYPPNGWGCRCNVLASSDSSGALAGDEAGIKIKGVVKDPIFQNNSGKSQIIYDLNKHPYFLNPNAKVSPLMAERNYGLKSIQKIYANANRFPERIKTLENEAELNKFWSDLSTKSKSTPEGSFSAKCAITNRLVLFDNELKLKFISKLKKGDNRLRDIPNMIDTVKSPDEIWTTRLQNKHGKSDSLLTFHLKFYSDEPLVVVSETLDNKVIVKSVYSPKTNIIEIRSGILEYKK